MRLSSIGKIALGAAAMGVLGWLVAGSLDRVTAQQSAPNAENAPSGAAGDGRPRGQSQGRRGGGPPDGVREGGRRGPPDGAGRAGRPPGAGAPGGGPGGGPPGRGRGGRRGGPTFVTLDAVIKGPVVETVPVYGRIVARQMGVVAARTRGAVATIEADVGDRVKKGQTIATLVSDMLRAERELKAAEVAEFRARVNTAEAQLKLSRQELKRLERLRRSAAFSQARYEDKNQDVARYNSGLSEAQAKLSAARAELRMADINLHNATIRAPFAGVVSQRHTEVGAFLNVGQQVVTLINDSRLEIEAEVPSARLKGLRIGGSLRGEFEDKSPFEASVRAVVPEENTLSRTRTVRFSATLGTNGRRIAVNQSVRLKIPVGLPREVVSVHKDAVVQRSGKPIVYVVIDGMAKVRPVQLGDAVGGRFEVLGGLQPGERVVVRGNERLRPDQPVRERRGGPA